MFSFVRLVHINVEIDPYSWTDGCDAKDDIIDDISTIRNWY